MSGIRERLTPPQEPLTPDQHYRAADELVADLEAMQVHELALPLGNAKFALADLHARLAQCRPATVVHNITNNERD